MHSWKTLHRNKDKLCLLRLLKKTFDATNVYVLVTSVCWQKNQKIAFLCSFQFIMIKMQCLADWMIRSSIATVWTARVRKNLGDDEAEHRLWLRWKHATNRWTWVGWWYDIDKSGTTIRDVLLFQYENINADLAIEITLVSIEVSFHFLSEVLKINLLSESSHNMIPHFAEVLHFATD